LLRAHPLIRGGAVTGPAFGRGVLNGSLEYARPTGLTLGRGLAVAGFVDAGRAWNRPEGRGASPLFVDAGVGVRAPAPGHDARLRIDLAHGLRGGGVTLSASWGMAWPR
jgi:outer membrane translocation and assembly module TamA